MLYCQVIKVIYVTLQGKMNAGASELMNEVRALPPSARARAYRGMAIFVEGVMDEFHMSSSALQEYVSSLKRDAEYEERRSEGAVRSRYNSV